MFSCVLDFWLTSSAKKNYTGFEIMEEKCLFRHYGFGLFRSSRLKCAYNLLCDLESTTHLLTTLNRAADRVRHVQVQATRQSGHCNSDPTPPVAA